ncbi:TadG family pilus assembly protein [soil metagenome]
MSAFLAGLGCVIAAVAIDVGSVALDARRLQGAADLAAMAASTNLGDALATARLNAASNVSGATVQTDVELGLYVADPALAPAQRFTPGPNGANAVRVTLHSTTPIYFGAMIIGKSSIPITRSALATVEPPQAMFSLGSRLASLDGGVANQVLSGLTGSSVSLSVMDYRALADAKVNLLAFSDALATELGVRAGDYEGLLDHTVNAGRALKVLEHLAGDSGDSALSKLGAAAVGVNLRLGDLIGVEANAKDGLAQGLDATVSALDLATAILEVGGGDRQVALDLGLNPGLAGLTASLAIGERPNKSPWLTVSSTGGPIIRTAQARLYLRAKTSQTLAGLAQVNLPILIELAASEARLNAITCDPARSVTVGVRPGLARASIGTIDESRLRDFKQTLNVTPATVLSVAGLVTLTAKAEVEAADQTFTPVRFTDADIKAQTLRSVQARGLVNGVVVSLLQRMQVEVRAGGLGLGLGGLVQALGVLLTPLGPVLDAAINPVLDILGLKFGEADVIVHGATCGATRPVLVG